MRTVGRAKAGFYPTPPSVIARLTTLLHNHEGHAGRLLDPCAGDGIVSALSHELGLESYGIELDKQRYLTALQRLAQVLRSDAFMCEVQPHSMSVLFCNPPYDSDGHDRTEATWLRRWSKTLQHHGILIYIIPEPRVTEEILRYLTTYYRNIRIYRFPHEEYRSFRQVIILGTKLLLPSQSVTLHRNLRRQLLLQTVPDVPEHGPALYSIPPPPDLSAIVFRTSWLPPEAILAEARTQGVWQDPRTHDALTLPAHITCRPLFPLHKGHMARIIAAGLVNNQLLATPAATWIIKGRARKITATLPPLSEEIHTKHGPQQRTLYRTIERFVPEIEAWDISPGRGYGRHIVIQC